MIYRDIRNYGDSSVLVLILLVQKTAVYIYVVYAY